MSFRIPLLLYPTTVVLCGVDDALVHNLRDWPSFSGSVVRFDSAALALTYLGERQREFHLARDVRAVFAADEDWRTDAAGQREVIYRVQLNLSHLSRLVADRMREREVACLLVGSRVADMGPLDALDLAAHRGVRRLLLAAPDTLAALHAHDAQLAHATLSAADPLDPHALAAHVAAQQAGYFDDTTHPWQQVLAAFGGTAGVLGSDDYAALFERVGADHRLAAWAFQPQPRGLLLRTREGLRYRLAIEHADDFEAHAEIAREAGAPGALVEALMARTVFPYDAHLRSLAEAPSGWESRALVPQWQGQLAWVLGRLVDAAG